MTEYDLWIWIRGWEDTFTASGRSIEECREWLKKRMAGGFESYVYHSYQPGPSDLHEAFE